MAQNPFDQFDAKPASGGGNPFDQFDSPKVAPKEAPHESTLHHWLVSQDAPSQMA